MNPIGCTKIRRLRNSPNAWIPGNYKQKAKENNGHFGNLKSYERSGNMEVGTFNDILTSDPNDTITFYLVDGKVSRWDKKTATSDADARSRAKSDADAKLKAKAYDEEILARAKADLASKTKAMEERSRYNASAQGSSTYEDDLMRTKQQERASSVREKHNWHYDGGLYYR